MYSMAHLEWFERRQSSSLKSREKHKKSGLKKQIKDEKETQSGDGSVEGKKMIVWVWVRRGEAKAIG